MQQDVVTVGVDLAKNVFQVHAISADGRVLVRRQLRRGEVLKFFTSLPPCLVGMEACASAHHWGRELLALGHDVRLMPPAYVKPYVKEREAFGTPIAQFQAIQFKLAEMAMGIETGRLMWQKAAWLVDQHQPHGYESAIAKAYCSEMAFDAANEAIQIHGGYGYVGEYPVEKLLRDVKLNQIYEGTNEIQRVVISRNLLK